MKAKCFFLKLNDFFPERSQSLRLRRTSSRSVNASSWQQDDAVALPVRGNVVDRQAKGQFIYLQGLHHGYLKKKKANYFRRFVILVLQLDAK